MTGLTIGDDIFEVEIEGDPAKPALLLSNALGTTLSMWDAQLPELTKHFRLIRYDPRGHGGSSEINSPPSIAELGGDVVAILDAVGVDKAHVLGLSMGGAVAIWLLVNAPQRIDRAVLANTAAQIGSTDAWNQRITSVLAGGTEENAAKTIDRWFSPEFASREPQRVQLIYDMLRAASPHSYAGACAALRDMDLQADLKKIRNEVLVISGRDDPTITEQDANKLAAGIADAHHLVLAARHMSNIEAHQDFNSAVVAFLTQPKQQTTRPRKSKATAPISSPTKRGGAERRSNAARRPLKKTPIKRGTAKKATGRAAAKKAEAHRRPTKKSSLTRRAEQKATSKRTVKKASTRKSTLTRRATPTAKARGVVAKKATKKAAKGAAKTSIAKAMKKLPTARRKPARKSRRSTGRRKT